MKNKTAQIVASFKKELTTIVHFQKIPKNISSFPYSMINLYTFIQDWRPLSYNYLISQICISDISLHINCLW